VKLVVGGEHVGKTHVEAGGLVAFGGDVSPATYRFGGSR
jgi:hypothetical protein